MSTHNVDTTTANIVSNIMFLTPKDNYIIIGINKLYLGTSLNWYEYFCIYITLIPDNIIQQNNLLPLVRNKIIYLEICKGMYGLSQAGILENDLLTEYLLRKGYF